MRVTYDWTDKGGESYEVEAEVHPIDYNKVSIISILSPDGAEVDFHDDCDDDEKREIRWLAKEAAIELDKQDEETYNDDNEEELDNEY